MRANAGRAYKGASPLDCPAESGLRRRAARRDATISLLVNPTNRALRPYRDTAADGRPGSGCGLVALQLQQDCDCPRRYYSLKLQKCLAATFG
jgi:hypothetical protein